MQHLRRYVAVLVASTGLIPPVSGHTIPAAVSAAARIAACPASVPTGDQRGKLVVDKLSRTYLLHVPPHIRAGHRYPLVIMLHPGYESLAPPVPEVTHMSTVADHHGFVVMYPDGVNGQWHTDAPDDTGVQGDQNDVRFMSRLIDALGTRVCLDLQRVYASGQSSGGTMAHRLACDLSARIAAIAPVYGTYTYTRCAPTHPVSLIAFHGTGPGVLPCHGGGPLVLRTSRRGRGGGRTATAASRGRRASPRDRTSPLSATLPAALDLKYNSTRCSLRAMTGPLIGTS